MRRLFMLAALLFALPARGVTIDWVWVGDPGNPADTEVMTCCGISIGTTGYGSVDYVYRISKYETTNAQYAEFLNAVADTDTYALYNTSMGSGYGGITRTGSSGSYAYSAIAGRENMPVNWVSFFDARRFANWLHNGQPSGAQDNTTTEEGAYTLSDPWAVRNANATIFLTSEDEWYKAAYFNGTSYLDYPAGTDTETAYALPGATANTANYANLAYDLTDVGSYTGSASPYGTFDQGGNLWEWNEGIIEWNRGVRGGSFQGGTTTLAAWWRFDSGPFAEYYDLGFRVAMIPEPSTALLLAAGLAGLAAARRRRQ